MAEQKSSASQFIFSIICAAAAVWYFWGGGIENQAASNMQEITNQVANDAVTQYGIAKRNGTAIDICVQAGMVTAAYLQAKDEANYQKWKQTQQADCDSAGMPG
ncbi:hypothetical protein B0F88_10383 [Methylobacter tundripaludum]|uniref:Uncharacterized protein n=1 Tax=Methylobacter tundripaludum TaxID=173365 RepID=A0A2S6H5F2_9GAMM|nr:hypothetical protein [Methylobacter tundripaludum]PPK72650.1 hypothetical protein B0F88_10383 [Methylobacter tundripaludum]